MALTMSLASPRERNILETEVLYTWANMAWCSQFLGVPKSPEALAIWLAKCSTWRLLVVLLRGQSTFLCTLWCASTLHGEKSSSSAIPSFPSSISSLLGQNGAWVLAGDFVASSVSNSLDEVDLLPLSSLSWSLSSSLSLIPSFSSLFSYSVLAPSVLPWLLAGCPPASLWDAEPLPLVHAVLSDGAGSVHAIVNIGFMSWWLSHNRGSVHEPSW